MSAEQLAAALSDVDEADIIWQDLISRKRAKWSPGMFGAYERSERAVVLSVNIDGWPLAWECRGRLMGAPYTDDGWSWRWFPLWSDPATLGCLLGQVRKRYGNPLLYIEPNGDEGWGLASPTGMVMRDYRLIRASTEVGVCLRALEVAP